MIDTPNMTELSRKMGRDRKTIRRWIDHPDQIPLGEFVRACAIQEVDPVATLRTLLQERRLGQPKV